MARTIINGVSNNARAETIRDNSDVIDGVRFVGTLDGKTCPYCASYDGYIWRGEDMATARRPPIHPNCRCTLVPVVDLKDADGNPIVLVDDDGNPVEERPAANADFDQLAKDAYNAQAKAHNWNRRWDDLAPSTRLKYYYKAQKDFEAKTGKPAYRQVPSTMTFKEYFDKQDDAFKKAWLGARAFDEYKSGKLSEKTAEKLLFNPNLTYQVKPESLAGWQAGYEATEAALLEEMAQAQAVVDAWEAEKAKAAAEEQAKAQAELEAQAANDPVYTPENYVWKVETEAFKHTFVYGDETKLDAILAGAPWSVFQWLEKNFQTVHDFEDVIAKKKPLESDYFSKENYEKAVDAWQDEKKRYAAFKNAFIDNLHAARNARDDAERKAIKSASAPLSVQFEGYGSWTRGANPEWLNGLTIEQLNALKALAPSAFETLNDDHGQAEPKSEDFFAPKNYETAQKQWNDAGEKITSFRTDVENAINAQIKEVEEKATQSEIGATAIDAFGETELEFPKNADALDGLEVIRTLDGSTGAKLVKDPKTGAQYVLKRGNNEWHIRSECEADALYRACGVRVPQFKMYETQDGSVKLSRYIPESQSLKSWWQNASQTQKDEMSKQLRKGLAVDVLLGNDGVFDSEYDHIVVDENGKAWRVNNGGALSYNAQGEKKDAKDWGKDCFIDELWTMTNDHARIEVEVPDASSIRKVVDFIGYPPPDALEMANEIIELESSDAFQTALAAFGKYEDDATKIEDKLAIKKRLEETRQAAARGNMYVEVEGEDPNFPRQTALDGMAYGYIMSKDGLREASAATITPQKPTFDKRHAGWLHWDSHDPKTLGGAKYEYIGEYLEHVIGAEEYDFCQWANREQGAGSYSEGSWARKYCVLKNLGYDCRKYAKFDDFIDDIQKAGYYRGHGEFREKTFNAIKAHPDELDRWSKAVLKHDVAMQILCEFDTVVGVDKRKKTITLLRTESDDAMPYSSAKLGGKSTHKPGVCESHSHSGWVSVKGGKYTVVRVPLCRIHGAWFMQRRKRSKGLFVFGKSQEFSNFDTQLYGERENEIPADTHGLDIWYLGEKEKEEWTAQQARNAVPLLERGISYAKLLEMKRKGNLG